MRTTKYDLVPPCAYQGGKQRLASQIVNKILEDNPCLLNEDNDTLFYDLCCGSGAISIEMINRGINPKKIVMIDKSPFTLFYKSIGEGNFNTNKFEIYINSIPEKSQIKSYMENLIKQDYKIDTEYKFLILQSGSFGSKAIWIDEQNNKWCTSSFRNYWMPTATSSRRSPVNPMMPLPETLLHRIRIIKDKMKNITAINNYIENIKIKPNSIIYIDPPYNDTAQYGYDFNYINFINNHKNNKIYLSEEQQLSNNAMCLSKGRNKGGINGKRKKKANEEWLNIYR